MTTTDASRSGPDLPDDRGLLGAIVDSTSDAVVSVDVDRTITSWNRAAERLYGYSRRQAIGAPIASVLPTTAKLADRVLRPDGVDGKVEHEGARRRSDGSSVMVSERLSPVLDADGDVVGVASIARDISERIALEQEVARRRVDLERTVRRLEFTNGELEQFAYVASHDLSEPLRAVAGMVGLLERRYKGRLDDDADEFIAFAVDGCERMRVMIADLLRYSRAGQLDLEFAPVDLNVLIGAVLADLSVPIEESSAEVTVAPELPTVMGDRSQLEHVFQNLIGNAVKFRLPDVPPRVEVTASRHDAGARPRWRIEVADNGIGIDEQHRDRVFRMFQRLHTSDRYPGSGIGLAIARRIVERHDGTISIGDNGGSATTFVIELPAVPIEHDDHHHDDNQDDGNAHDDHNHENHDVHGHDLAAGRETEVR